MILRGDHGDDGTAVGKGHDRELFAIQELFDQYPPAGLSERRLLHHIANRLTRVIPGGCHHDSLALSQSIGFHDDRNRMLIQIGQCRFDTIKAASARRENTVIRQQLLRKTLARFNAGRRLRRAEDAQICLAEFVCNPQRQRRFRTHDREVDFLGDGEVLEAGDIIGGNRHARCQPIDSGVAGRAEEPGDARALRDLPDQCMLAPTAPDDKNPHVSALFKRNVKMVKVTLRHDHRRSRPLKMIV